MAFKTYITLGFSLLASALGIAYAQQGSSSNNTAELLQQAIVKRITVSFSHRKQQPVFARHCRKAKVGCEARIEAFTGYLIDAAEHHDVDAWLLAAMAFRESSFDPFAEGALGEVGILQLHPKSPWGRKIRFVRDKAYRARCRRHPGACQREIVFHAAEALAKSLEQCEGNLGAALGAYNTGRCAGNRDYAARVLREYRRLRTSVGLEAHDPRVIAATRDPSS